MRQIKYIFLVIIIILLILFVPVYAVVEFDKELVLFIRIGPFKVYSNKQSKKKVDKEADEEVDKTVEKDKFNVIEYFENFRKIFFDIILKLKRYLTLVNLEIDYKFGFKDAALTGMYSGVVYTAVNCFMAYIDSEFNVKNTEIKITPDFNECGHIIKTKVKIRLFLLNLIQLIFKLMMSIHK